MPYSAFVDKEQCPTMKELLAMLGVKRHLWENLIRFIEENFRIKNSDLRFCGKNYGWALRFRKGGKALISLYPAKEGFTAQIIIGRSEAEKAFSLPLGDNTRKVLENAHEYHEGRWLFLNMQSEQDAEDVQQLLLLKSRPSEK